MIKQVQEAADKIALAKKEFSELPASSDLSKEMTAYITFSGDNQVLVTITKHSNGDEKLASPQGLHLPLPEAKELAVFLTKLFSEE